MQKKKKVTTSKSKTVKKATAKPIVKKTAKKIAEKKVVKGKLASKPVLTKKAEPKETVTPVQEAMAGYKPKVDIKSLDPEAQEQYKRWLKLHKQMSEQKPEEYKMTSDYDLKAPLKHKVHGWGVVMQKRDNYIDVLFETGIKTLIVNYKEA